jgi:HSP20 family molecular chaperone IbpA
MAEQTVPAPKHSQGNGDGEITRAPERHVRPPVDIYETPDALAVIADMPGVSKENLQVQVDEGMLTIQGKAARAVPGDPIYLEFDPTGFFRQFELSEDIDTENINAELKHGVLTLRLPKTEMRKKQIEVKVS